MRKGKDINQRIRELKAINILEELQTPEWKIQKEKDWEAFILGITIKTSMFDIPKWKKLARSKPGKPTQRLM